MRALSWILLVAAGLVACGDSRPATSAATTEPSSFLGNGGQPQSVDLGLIERMMLAPSNTAYSAKRKVSFYMRDEFGVVDELTYIESVRSDGHESFRVTPEEVLQPQLSEARAEIFMLVQKGRSEFFYNHRDFRVRDRNLFLSNYEVALLNIEPTVVGRACLRLDVRRRGGNGRHYEVDVDRATGLILMQRELSAQNERLSQVEFLELELGRPVSDTLEAVDTVLAPSWRPSTIREGLTGLSINAPSFPPRGFQLLDERIVTDPLGNEWFELVYGDGVEQLFMLFARNRSRTNNVIAEDEMRVFRHGSWTVVEGQLRGERIIALGKVSQDDLVLTIESCL